MLLYKSFLACRVGRDTNSRWGGDGWAKHLIACKQAWCGTPKGLGSAKRLEASQAKLFVANQAKLRAARLVTLLVAHPAKPLATNPTKPMRL